MRHEVYYIDDAGHKLNYPLAIFRFLYDAQLFVESKIQNHHFETKNFSIEFER